MSDFINKHVLKIQLGVLVAMLVTVAYWSYTASAYVFAISSNSEGVKENANAIHELNGKFETLATRSDLLEMKKDLKDLINSKHGY